MAATLLKPGLYAVGQQNPNLRVFDIVMRTDYGTTYNAYVVRGEQKTALIECVHEHFQDGYLSDLETVCDLSTVDTLILNHTEPDHSGSLGALLDRCPNLTVYATRAGIQNVRRITGRDFNAHEVKAGDTLDLGGVVLSFFIAPNLHWPDSMFTYAETLNTVFTCDFLGCHYCEPRVLDQYITYLPAYQASFAYYYAAIFGPFPRFVQQGLAILDRLLFDTVCPSHGPVLQKGIDTARVLYRQWSDALPVEKSVLIAYASAYGYTKMLAVEAADALRAVNVKVRLCDLVETSPQEAAALAHDATALLIGSPTLNRDAVPPVWEMLVSLDAITQKGKKVALFGSYGWSGEALPHLEERVKQLGMTVTGTLKVQFKPTQEECNAMRALAVEVVG